MLRNSQIKPPEITGLTTVQQVEDKKSKRACINTKGKEHVLI
jgi:hypothetical protein